MGHNSFGTWPQETHTQPAPHHVSLGDFVTIGPFCGPLPREGPIYSCPGLKKKRNIWNLGRGVYPSLILFEGKLIYALNKFCGTFGTFCAEDWCVFTVQTKVSKPIVPKVFHWCHPVLLVLKNLRLYAEPVNIR